jgi:geranylgeranyl diphosphate synthase, type I
MDDCWQLIARLLDETLRGEPLTEAYATAILQRLDRWASFRAAEPSVADLPLLACAAAGGTHEQSVPVGAAWQMLHIAAKLFDDLEDGDADDPALDINIATAVLVTVPLLLAKLSDHGLSPAQIQRLTHGAQRAVLHASAGQHADLLAVRGPVEAIDPDRWLAIARAKSGALLAWAAWAGALAGGAAEDRLDHFLSYGEQLGVLLQIADDFIGTWRPERDSDLATGQLSLPVCYALSVVAPPERAALLSLLAGAAEPETQARARQRLIELGAQAYSMVMARVFQQQALAALQRIDPAQATTQPLARLVEGVFPKLEQAKLR